MKIEKDNIGRCIVQPVEDDTKLYFDIDTSTSEPHLAIYQGHDSQLINDRLEALDCSNFLSLDDVDELIELLKRYRVEMNSINFIESTKRAIVREIFTLKDEMQG